ncbi:MAG: division/cell wall cluster transcriptional repressor MraZ [Proteobacteria bacterium]|nr:division/cell wall cluster transcriptional repressor MraZ [Pseudomonadota bacterium]
MTLFLSTFINKLDKKGRVSVPASFRLMLGGQTFQGIVGFRSYKLPTIEGMGIDRMQRLSESVDQFDVFSEAQDDLTATIFADAQMMAFDGDGRVVVPPLLLEHAKIQESVAFVGRGATFQIWNPTLFEDHQKEARKRVHEKKATFKIWGPHA